MANAVTRRVVPSPSIEVGDLQRLSADDARAFVDRHLGPPESWPDQLPGWRLAHPSQDDWKIELGEILHTAAAHGYLPALVSRLERAKREHKKFVGKRLANDKSHLDLMAELAPATADHYFTGTGWGLGHGSPVS